jgi:hypothetical protein
MEWDNGTLLLSDHAGAVLVLDNAQRAALCGFLTGK